MEKIIFKCKDYDLMQFWAGRKEKMCLQLIPHTCGVNYFGEIKFSRKKVKNLIEILQKWYNETKKSTMFD